MILFCNHDQLLRLTFDNCVAGHLFGKLVGFNYIAKLFCAVLNQLGFRIRPDLPVLLSTVSYSLYMTEFIDKFKEEFLQTFFPTLKENRRQSYVVNRFCSVAIWTIGVLIVCEMFSIYFRVPLSSTLAFGGVGGLAIGLSARSVFAILSVNYVSRHLCCSKFILMEYF